MVLKTIKQLIYLGILLVVVASLYLGYQFNEFRNSAINMQQDSAEFLIKPGNSIRQVAQKLADAGYIEDPVMFIALAKIEGKETSAKAGEYLIKQDDTPLDLIDLFTRGNSILYSFTIIEGWTFNQLLEAIKKDAILEHTLPNNVSEIMAKISQDDESPEGRFLPDTYHFPRGTTDLDFLKRSYKTMQQKLSEEWAKRDNDLPLKSPYEALILASIIEKETGAAFERPLIAAAFIQRLKKGMRLQTDPTIIYGLGEGFDGNIRYRDLKKDTPYNTYLHKGLTPTPIALPGIDAIRAALHPADSDAIYFVSKGDGTHKFSRTLEEHNEAVSKYQLKGRKPKRTPQSG
jgi:UPF0755 protein